MCRFILPISRLLWHPTPHPNSRFQSTRVSNELGAGRPHAAQLAVQVVLFLAITEGLSVSLLAVAVRGVWGYMYTNEEELIRYLAAIMPVLAVSNFIDGIQGALSGPTLIPSSSHQKSFIHCIYISIFCH